MTAVDDFKQGKYAWASWEWHGEGAAREGVVTFAAKGGPKRKVRVKLNAAGELEVEEYGSV